jgi:hypothetical protein
VNAHDGNPYPAAGGRVRVQVVEPRRDCGPLGSGSLVASLELNLRDAGVYLAALLDDGYTVLVQKRDGTGSVLYSSGDLPVEARSVLAIRVSVQAHP